MKQMNAEIYDIFSCLIFRAMCSGRFYVFFFILQTKIVNHIAENIVLFTPLKCMQCLYYICIIESRDINKLA